MSKQTIKAYLKALGITSADPFAGATNMEGEFKVVKSAYFKLVLAAHPDKGGDPGEALRVPV